YTEPQPTQAQPGEAPTEAPSEEAPPEEQQQADEGRVSQEEIDKTVKQIQSLSAAPKAPETKTQEQRIAEAFKAGLQRMTPAERAQAQQYQQNVTPQLQRDFVDRKIDVYQFMARVSGYSEGLVRQFAPTDKVQALERVANDARAGIASDRTLQQAYSTAMSGY